MEFATWAMQALLVLVLVGCPIIGLLYLRMGFRWGYRPTVLGKILLLMIAVGTPFAIWRRALEWSDSSVPSWIRVLAILPIAGVLLGILVDCTGRGRLLVPKDATKTILNEGHEAYRLAALDHDHKKNPVAALTRAEQAFRKVLARAPDSAEAMLGLASTLYMKSLNSRQPASATLRHEAERLCDSASEISKDAKKTDVYRIIRGGSQANS
jgi:hypothetical protein